MKTELMTTDGGPASGCALAVPAAPIMHSGGAEDAGSNFSEAESDHGRLAPLRQIARTKQPP
jgi:hypothetical protein